MGNLVTKKKKNFFARIRDKLKEKKVIGAKNSLSKDITFDKNENMSSRVARENYEKWYSMPEDIKMKPETLKKVIESCQTKIFMTSRFADECLSKIWQNLSLQQQTELFDDAMEACGGNIDGIAILWKTTKDEIKTNKEEFLEETIKKYGEKFHYLVVWMWSSSPNELKERNADLFTQVIEKCKNIPASIAEICNNTPTDVIIKNKEKLEKMIENWNSDLTKENDPYQIQGMSYLWKVLPEEFKNNITGEKMLEKLIKCGILDFKVLKELWECTPNAIRNRRTDLGKQIKEPLSENNKKKEK